MVALPFVPHSKGGDAKSVRHASDSRTNAQNTLRAPDRVPVLCDTNITQAMEGRGRGSNQYNAKSTVVRG